MRRANKVKYTDKQERQADRAAAVYIEHGLPEDEAERLAWATVNDIHRSGEKPGGRKGRPR